MAFKLDHIVHFVNSPLNAIEELKKQGLHAVEGGRHENLGTYNALSYFEKLSYIELIGVFDQKLVEKAAGIEYTLRETFKKDNYIEGLSRIALRSTDLEADAEHFRKLGLEVYGPSPLSRKRPDGSLVTWKLLHAGRRDEQLDLPFFIQWDQGDGEREKDLTEQQTIANHPAGKISISSVGFAVNNVDEAIEKWSKYLSLEVGEPYEDSSLNAKGQKLKLDGGDIAFYSPNGHGLVADTLANRGEKPFLIEFSGANKEVEFQLFGATYRFLK